MAKIIDTITPDDYKNLSQKYSEKNIINQTNGNEYVIDVASVKTIEDMNEKSTEVTINPLNGGNRVYLWDWGEYGSKGLFDEEYIELREEYYRHSGTITIETDEIITDVNDISVDVSLSYDKYHYSGNLTTGSNYTSSNSIYKAIMQDAYKTNTELMTATEKLPYEHSRASVRDSTFFDWTRNVDVGLDGSFPSNTIKAKCTKTDHDTFKITVTYNIVTWWGKNWGRCTQYEEKENTNTLWVVRKLAFTIKANTVDSREIEFNYARDDEVDYVNAKGKNYPIESNEFMQTDENSGETERQSYQTSQEIFSAFDQDRAIVSFTLLNCKKYDIDGVYRYLRSEDLIYVQDANRNVICDEINANGELIPSVFEIIKTRPIWDGTFSMEVVCRRIDMTT